MAKQIICQVLFVFIVVSYSQKNAGVVCYFKNGSEIFVLIADHKKKDRGWASFGGGAKKGETNGVTALREFQEETKKIFDPDNISSKLTDSVSVELENFVSFFVEVKFIPSQILTSKKMKGKKFNERKNYIWVPLSELLRAINKNPIKPRLNNKFLPKSSSRRDIFIPFAEVLLKAQKSKLLESL